MKTISTVTILILGLVLPQPKEALVLPFNSRIPKPNQSLLVLSTLKPTPDQIKIPQNKAGMKNVDIEDLRKIWLILNRQRFIFKLRQSLKKVKDASKTLTRRDKNLDY